MKEYVLCDDTLKLNDLGFEWDPYGSVWLFSEYYDVVDHTGRENRCQISFYGRPGKMLTISFERWYLGFREYRNHYWRYADNEPLTLGEERGYRMFLELLQEGAFVEIEKEKH